MSDDDILTREEFDEYLDYIMSDCDIAEWTLGQLAVVLLDAKLAISRAGARIGALRALKYLLCNGCL